MRQRYRHLCASIIWRAVLDFCGYGSPYDRRDAYKWLFLKRGGLIDFDRACQYADMRPEVVRRAAREARSGKLKIDTKAFDMTFLRDYGNHTRPTGTLG
jgi:hypothetical protein